MTFKVKEFQDWEVLVEKITPLLKHNILLLKGNLGAGKTTFSQFLLKKLGSEDEVNSPTYSLVNEYQTPKGKVFHFDLYRINKIEELFDIGMDEYLETGFLSIIEWPEIYENELQGLSYHTMTIINNLEEREIEFK
ncbi:MAG: tRNA (adenosine(37)-N6)-threonylcarbamoyltransferase complex ATPase subunit type 1 TsaE [Flavobacteriaceae bacterium]|nr:tRNA (adenosine(37)-N6)-threonylcarbamoyltransferase complex ATPase subunit type 1 TsaE [Flavobacteriaceae bacterium]